MNSVKNKKIYVLLPDGVGLRNFAYTDFYKLGKEQGYDIVFWNNTPFDLQTLGYDEIKISNSKSNPLTEIYKNARKQIELNLNIRRSNDCVYDSYRFSFSYKTFNATVKSLAVKLLTFLHSSENGLKHVRAKIKTEERKTLYYRQCLETLKAENPSLVFSTNQRAISAIAPILAAQELGIPTVSFIYSWDNLPKATMVIEPDFYLVWSEHMKNELRSYYPYVTNDRIFTTGTPQFELHYDPTVIMPKDEFFAKHGLDFNKKYICYSGDDVSTSPNDPLYLRDTAEAVRRLNSRNHNFGVLFRRCPVDFSPRYDSVLESYKDVITVVDPVWKTAGNGWNTVLPSAEDTSLLINTAAHCEMVVNLGSSMVFDFVTADKPCAYVNYDYPISNPLRCEWSVKKTYNFVHFRSMPSRDCVAWLNDAESIASTIESLLENKTETVAAAKKWFQKINAHPVDKASVRIFEAFDTIMQNTESK